MSWSSQGGLVRALGGLTKEEVIKALKLEVVPGGWSDPAVKKEDGSFTAYAAPTLCPEGSILISAYCGIVDDPKVRTTANLQRAGLSKDFFYCTWNNVGENQKISMRRLRRCV